MRTCCVGAERFARNHRDVRFRQQPLAELQRIRYAVLADDHAQVRIGVEGSARLLRR